MSEHDSVPPPAEEEVLHELPSIGAFLRAEREARGESVVEVAVALKMSARQVVAMEEDRFEDLPGPAFVKGFLRNYGKHLGVDLDPLIALHWPAVESSRIELKPLTNASGTMPSSGRRGRFGRTSVVVAVLAVVVLALVWYFDGFRMDAVDDEVPLSGTVEEPATQWGEPLPLPEPVQEEGVSAAVEDWPAGPLIPVSPSAEPMAEVAVIPQGEAPAAESSAASAAVIESAAGRIVFRLREDAWLQIRDASERTLYTGISQAGTTRVVQGQPPFALVVGNAANVTVEHDGRTIDLKAHTQASGVARLKVE